MQLAPALLAVVALTGCAAVLSPRMLGDRAEATVEVRTEIKALRSVQNIITPYSSADIDHLVIKIFSVSGSTETPATSSSGPLEGDLPGPNLGTSLVFAGLKNNATYRVRGYAYRKAGAQSQDLISDTGSCFVDVALTDDDRPQPATLSVQLIDRMFSGAGTGAIEVKTGPLEGPGADEAILVEGAN